MQVSVSGPDGKLGDIAVQPLHSVEDLRTKVSKLLGPEAGLRAGSPWFKLVWDGKPLRDLSANFHKLVGGGTTAAVTVIKLEGPDQLRLDKLQEFKTLVDQGAYKDGDVGFSLKNLHVLSLTSFPEWLSAMHAEGPRRKKGLVDALDGMTGLKELDLTGNHISDPDAMRRLAEHLPRSLEVLRLSYPSNYMASLAEGMLTGAPLAKLRELHFSESWVVPLPHVKANFVESLVRCLPSLTSLEALVLKDSKVSPQALSELPAAMPKSLRSLDLTGNFVYDASEDGILPELKPFLLQLPSLQELHLTCKENSEASQASLRKNLPAGCKTIFEKQVALPAPKLAASFHTAASVPVRGFWTSEGGEFRIFNDSITAQLSYEELIGDGCERLFGRLEDKGKDSSGRQRWQASLMIMEVGQAPWYGPSCGPKPEVVGDIMVTLRVKEGGEPEIETRIKTDDDEDWLPPKLFKPRKE